VSIIDDKTVLVRAVAKSADAIGDLVNVIGSGDQFGDITYQQLVNKGDGFYDTETDFKVSK